jgi:hypothetical protein
MKIIPTNTPTLETSTGRYDYFKNLDVLLSTNQLALFIKWESNFMVLGTQS